MPKMIIVDIMDETAEVKIETKGYEGMKCVEESQFLKDALGKEIEQNLLPIAFKNKQTNKEKRKFKSICG